MLMTVKTKFQKSNGENLNTGSRPDALTRYMSEISKIIPLTRDEECELGHKIAEGDIAALQKLVQRNLKYVVSIANKYRRCGLSLQDLIEEGNIGIIQAAKRFDPSREVKFITYAVWWIKQAIVHSLASYAGAVKLPVKQAVKMHRGLKISKILAQSLGQEPTQSEIARHQKLSMYEYENIMRGYQKQLSLDTPLKNGEDTTYRELLEKQDAVPCDEQVIRQELNSKISELLMNLPEREKEILRMRFGFDGEAKTLEEIGRKIGVSRERVRQIEKRAKEKLKRKSNSKTSFEPLS